MENIKIYIKGIEYSGDELVDVDVAVRMLGLAKRTVQDMASARKLPVHKIGRNVRFKVRELVAWIETKRVSSDTCALF